MVLCCKNRRSTKSERVPEFYVRHKEPDDKWWFLKNIPIEFDKEFDSKKAQETTTRSSKYDQKLVYIAIKELKSHKGEKKLNWTEVCQEMANKQKNGEISYHYDFSKGKANTVAHIFYELRKTYENEESKD